MLCYTLWYDDSNFVRLFLKAGANPKATITYKVNNKNIIVDMFWYNALQLIHDTTTKDFEVRLKIVQIIFDAGARPVMNQDVYNCLIKKSNHFNKSQASREVCIEETKRVFQELETMCYRCQSLAEIARTHLYDQMRLVRGPLTTTILSKRLLEDILPYTLHKFFQFE